MNKTRAYSNRRVLFPYLLAAAMVCAAWMIPDAKAQLVPAAPAVPSATDQAPALSVPPTYVGPMLMLNAGDQIEVQVFATPELSGRFRLDQKGDLSIPLAGTLHAAGMTADQAAVAIENLLRAQQIMKDPHVHVNVTEYVSQGITITGEVKKPGLYPLYGNVTLYDLLSAAGGFTVSTGSSIAIAHRGSTQPMIIPITSPNFSEQQHITPILPGDTVVVAAAELVYVVGDVGNQGQFPITYGQPMTLLQLMSLARGLNETSKGSKAAIVRQTEAGATIIDVNLAALIKNRNLSQNLILQAKDILVVPRSFAKELLLNTLPNITSSAATSAITSVLVR